MVQGSHLRRGQCLVATATHFSRQRHRTVGRADKSADLIADRFPQSPNLTITPLLKSDVEPAIRAVSTGVLD